MKEKVLIALSGGVDSSVAAYLLKEQGYEVIGATLDIEKPENQNKCCKISLCQAICKKLDIPYHIIEARKLFKQKVIDYFIEEYKNGHTPNPCMPCNLFLKFHYLLSYAQKNLNCQKLATGHYVLLKKDSKNIFHIYKGMHQEKDQSYFMHALDQNILSHLIFPIGELKTKEAVREIARKLELPSADIKESQDICFVKNNEFPQFFKKHKVKSQKGNICKKSGEIIGQHQGIMFYTIGQRRGIGVADKKPLYVIGLDAQKNEVIVAYEKDLYKQKCHLKKVNLLSGALTPKSFQAEVKTRYHSKPVLANIELKQNKTALVHFHEPIKAITPGQFAVFYKQNEVLGGGMIV